MSGEIEAGPELDCEVAEKVFGYEYESDDGTWRSGRRGKFQYFEEALPRYSTEIGAAWSVVEKLESEGMLACVGRLPAGWTCCFADWERTTPREIAPTAPLAICKAALRCRAALAAVGAQK